jgi:hypothetical protein
MVRIHARQPAQDQVFTGHHQKRGKDIFFNAGDFAEPGSFGSLFRKPRVASPRAKPLKFSILEIDGGSMF